jgi:2-oxoisovalerate ferredoxin oxidoreductase beta subunit
MARDTLRKPESFHEVFARKPGSDQQNTHYCPGCGHGIAHKLIAEAIDELGIQDRVIFAAPVGCAVFLYYYFHCSAFSAAHGRAPAALTAVARVRPDSIAISYQGDGDLAAIGTSNIIHAANRGESIAVFFINNAIYGMTGGQMAPTSVLGMKTMTSPRGRCAETEGHPLRMCEIIQTLEAPVYIERVSLDSPRNVIKARAAVRKSLTAQKDRQGFTFVEILSPCPTNWHVDPAKAGEWIRENMLPVFPLGVLRDRLATAPTRPEPPHSVTNEELDAVLGVDRSAPDDDALLHEAAPQPLTQETHFRFAGFGGQGVLSLGLLVAQAAMLDGHHVTCIPSYGPEMRGGTANSAVVVSPARIGSPVVDRPHVLLTLNHPSFERFLPTVREGGLVLYNSTLSPVPPAAPDGVTLLGVPANEIAQRLGEPRAANVVLLGAYSEVAPVMTPAALDGALAASFANPKVLAVNRLALEAGRQFAREHQGRMWGAKKGENSP